MESLRESKRFNRLFVGVSVLTVAVCFVLICVQTFNIQNLQAKIETLDERLSSIKSGDANTIRGRVRRQASIGCGVQFERGRDGRDGRDGLRGPEGPSGPRGTPGPRGPQGAPGSSSLRFAAGEFENILARVINATQKHSHTPTITVPKDTSEEIKTVQGITGTSYVRWGREQCPQGASLLYEGIAGGKHHTHTGGGAEILCLPKEPQWGNFTDGHQSKSYIYGTEYQVYDSNNPFINKGGQKILDHDVPCAVCYVANRGHQLMIPAWRTCPSGWRREYHGYLMAGHYSHKTNSFVCVDETPDVDIAGAPNQNGALLYNVEATCGSLPCPHYVNGRELTCVVCTK